MMRPFQACLFALLLWSPAAHAGAVEALDVGLSGGLLLVSPESDLLGDRSKNTTLTDAAIVGVRAGYRLEELPVSVQLIALTFPAHYHPGILKGSGALVTMEALGHLKTGPLTWSAGGGVGALALVAGTAGEDTDLAYSAGGGVRWTPPASAASLRLDGKAILSDGLGSGMAIHTLITLGVDFALSHHAHSSMASQYPGDDDNDGVVNARDLCPRLAGTPSMSGCPDGDRDGVADDRDACPETSGIAAFHGCPDTDADSVPDTTDACPTIPGSVEHAGCPDTDADGIADSRDRCKRRAGSASREGCPTPPAAVLSMFGRPFDSLVFVGKPPGLTLESYDVIREVARVLEEHPQIELQVRGYTHDRKRSERAYSETEDRAAVVVRALIAEGIDPGRLSALGLGSEQPIASNRTRAGRDRNHRVELHVVRGGERR